MKWDALVLGEQQALLCDCVVDQVESWHLYAPVLHLPMHLPIIVYLDQQICHLYRQRNHLVSYNDRALFKTFTLDECLRLSSHLKSTWIEYPPSYQTSPWISQAAHSPTQYCNKLL